MVIQFRADGRGLYLHTELLPLAELGRLEVRRASMVQFNHATQQWEVTLAGESVPAFAHPSRAVCLDWEVQTLNQRMLVGD